jgi:endonuclease-8
MPEGDSLHRAAARLRPLVGHRVEASSPHPRGLATGVAAAVDGRRLESVQAVGKHLLLRFEGGVTVRSHLRMNGRWRVGSVGTTQRVVSRLGPDLLADRTEPEALVPRLRRADPSAPVGEVLQDQRLVAGIGNMWMSETLWAVRVSPLVPIRDVDDGELAAALRWAREAMLASVAGARATRGVYRRAGRPCRRCGERIASRGLGDANRTAYWCPRCQPLSAGDRFGAGARG